MLFWLDHDLVDTVFVITKKSLVTNWLTELASHSYITPRVLSDNRRTNSIALNSAVLIYVLNYEVIRTNEDILSAFLDTCRVGAILDESQKLRNPDSQISISLHSLSHQFVRRIIMTGTPVANRPHDIWSQVKFLDHGESLGASFDHFKAGVDLPRNSTSPADYARSLASIMERIKSFSVRETKLSSGIELPEKTIVTHFVTLAPQQYAIYASYRDDMRHELTTNGHLVVDDAHYIMKRLLRLVQCASNPHLIDPSYSETPAKTQTLRQLIDEINVRSTKAVIWTSFVANVETLFHVLAYCHPRKVHGRMSTYDRDDSIEAFCANDDCRLLIATPGAAKEGLTLTVANHAIFYDRGFSLDDYLQAQDRIHRISQTESCFVHNLIAIDTIDEWVDALLNTKHQAAQVAQGDISGTTFEQIFTEDLGQMLRDILRSEPTTSAAMTTT